ncbi:hypothetical protein PHYNN_225 [Pantoea phage Phynn]|nr:hypothetical protein PHYNN_225 [Pantoea phage Phynn]
MLNLERLTCRETPSNIESWTLETLQNWYTGKPLTKEIVYKALSERDYLFTYMESTGRTDMRIVEMCDYLMEIRNIYVRMLLDMADRDENSAEYLRNQARNI